MTNTVEGRMNFIGRGEVTAIRIKRLLKGIIGREIFELDDLHAVPV